MCMICVWAGVSGGDAIFPFRDGHRQLVEGGYSVAGSVYQGVRGEHGDAGQRRRLRAWASDLQRGHPMHGRLFKIQVKNYRAK